MLNRNIQRGFSVVETMIAVAIGLFIVLGILTFFSVHAHKERQVVSISTYRHDIKDLMDLMGRELRRAGYWGGAVAALQSGEPVDNPFQDITVDEGCILYAYDKNGDGILQTSDQAGFYLNKKDARVYYGSQVTGKCGEGSWRPITGPEIVVEELRFEVIRVASEVASKNTTEKATAVRRTIKFHIKSRPLDRYDSPIYEGQVQVMNDIRESTR